MWDSSTATAVLDPHLSKDIQKLESNQHFACRVRTKRWNDAYSDMLYTLNIPPLSERRKLLKCVICTRLSMDSLTS